jgi:hypothetical protein
MKNNLDMPAMPLPLGSETSAGQDGLTKREQACIALGLPESGDEEIDALIIKSERKRIAAMAMQGLCSKGGYDSFGDIAYDAVIAADRLLAELDK